MMNIWYSIFSNFLHLSSKWTWPRSFRFLRYQKPRPIRHRQELPLPSLEPRFDFRIRRGWSCLLSMRDNLPPWVHSAPRHNQAHWELYARIPILRLHMLSWFFQSMHYNIHNFFLSQRYSQTSRGILGSGEVQVLGGDPLDHLPGSRVLVLWPFVDVEEVKQAIQPRARKL